MNKIHHVVFITVLRMTALRMTVLRMYVRSSRHFRVNGSNNKSSPYEIKHGKERTAARRNSCRDGHGDISLLLCWSSKARSGPMSFLSICVNQQETCQNFTANMNTVFVPAASCQLMSPSLQLPSSHDGIVVHCIILMIVNISIPMHCNYVAEA